MIRAALLSALALAACNSDETLYNYGAAGKTWVLSEVNDAPFTQRTTLEFGEDGAIFGAAPCNRYSGTQTEPYPWFGIAAVLSTKRACPDLAAETAYFSALERMSLAEVGNTTLILSNDDGEALVFTAEQAAE